MRRAAPKTVSDARPKTKPQAMQIVDKMKNTLVPSKKIPNHLQDLNRQAVRNNMKFKETVSTSFFNNLFI